MSDRRVCLEAVAQKTEDTAMRVASVWLTRGTLMSLMERLAVNEIRTAEAPSFDWILNSGYIYRAGGPARDDDPITATITSNDPIPSLCVDPNVAASALRWIDRAIRSDVLMDRQTAWRDLNMVGTFDDERFISEFEDDIKSWLGACTLASEIGGKVVLRVDA